MTEASPPCPVEAAEANTIEIHDLESQTPVDQILVSRQPVILELVLRDATGNFLVTHARWTLSDTSSVQFPEGDPIPTTDVFIDSISPSKYESPVTGFRAHADGTTVLSAESGAGRAVMIPVEAVDRP